MALVFVVLLRRAATAGLAFEELAEVIKMLRAAP